MFFINQCVIYKMKIDDDIDSLTNSLLNCRLNRENASFGECNITLMWNDPSDLDLHVICPCGEEISFTNRRSKCGGILDVDMNRYPCCSVEPVENIFWNEAPIGNYKVFVKNFRTHDIINNDYIPFTVAIKNKNKVMHFTGKVKHHEIYVVYDNIL